MPSGAKGSVALQENMIGFIRPFLTRLNIVASGSGSAKR